MDALAQIVVWLNNLANAVGRIMLTPIGVLPGWVSATLVAVVCGVVFLVIFKYTSFQRSIKRVRNQIKANLLALKLFKDSAAVAVRAQGNIFAGVFLSLLLAVVPVLVMLVPVSLILGQLALWYQARPLRVGEDALVTMKLNGEPGTDWPDVRLIPSDAVDVTIGPVRVASKREMCWNIQARKDGHHRLAFQVDGQAIDKELAIGDGFMRVSVQRPARQWLDALEHPEEPPFGSDSPVQFIEIAYPQRSSWTSGSNSWVIYWFAVSMIGALCFRRILNVNL